MAAFDSRRTGDRTAYAYEDLAEVAEVIDPILNKNGLSHGFKSKVDSTAFTAMDAAAFKLYFERAQQALAEQFGFDPLGFMTERKAA